MGIDIEEMVSQLGVDPFEIEEAVLFTANYVIRKGSGKINKDLWIVHREGERIHGVFGGKASARIAALKEADSRNELASLQVITTGESNV